MVPNVDRQLSAGPFWAIPEPDLIDPEVGRGVSIILKTFVLNAVVWSIVALMWFY